MSSLAQLQRALQANVIDGESAIAEGIDSSTDIPAATRLQIYSAAYRLRLIEALQANYPVLAQLVGDDEFARMAQLYLALHPSRHYSIRWFGHRLAEFLSEFPDREQPWLPELAEWEWKIATAFDSADANSLSIDHLALLAPEEWPELRLTFHSSVQRMTLTTNVVAVVKAATVGESLPEPMRLTTSSEWLIWRQELIVQYRSLDAAAAAAIDAAIGGATFSELCEALVDHTADEDQIPLIAASFLKQWITDRCVVSFKTA